MDTDTPYNKRFSFPEISTSANVVLDKSISNKATADADSKTPLSFPNLTCGPQGIIFNHPSENNLEPDCNKNSDSFLVLRLYEIFPNITG